ncbi:MAG: PIN domain-containing protein [Oscillatoria princeps RMCB-10]|jgi:predicted nucleic acid-binding protein|nr:PIN domain-containing protein [Oscillatoria princeps RMCB-10]
MRVLLDTNIILDALLQREPFVRDAKALFEAIESQRVIGYVTATTLTDIFYIVRKNKGAEIGKQEVATLLAGMQVCTVNRAILEAAVSSNMSDFEDAVQLACAMADNLDAIVTRDTEGFTGTSLPVLSAGELMERLS